LTLAQASAGFKLPPLVQEAWDRLANRGGSVSDAKRVIDFLGQLWAYDQHDPRAFDEWLVGQGVKKDDLRPEVVADFKASFDRWQELKLKHTRVLTEGFALGPHSAELLSSLRTFSGGLKRLAYETAILMSRGDKLVLVLCYLSQETSELVQECISRLQPSTVSQTFSAYSKGARLPLALGHSNTLQVHPAEDAVDRLFGLATLPVMEMQEALRRMPKTEVVALVRLAETLTNRVPNVRFGEFVKLNLAVFICTAEPKGKSAESASQTLVSTREPGVADILSHMGEAALLAVLHDPQSLKQRECARLFAAIIDAVRKNHSDSITSLKGHLQSLSRSKTPVVAVAARAALLGLGLQKQNTFEKFLLRNLQADKDQFVAEWLRRNPEFVRYVRVEQSALKAWKAILESFKTRNPALALKIVEQMLGEPLKSEENQFAEVALGILAQISGNEADLVFVGFLSHQIKEAHRLQLRGLFSREPLHAMFRRTFWQSLERNPSEQVWAFLFDIYRAGVSQTELVKLLETAAQGDRRLATWVTEQLLPRLLEEEALSASFHRSISSHEFLVAAAKQLSRSALENARYLRQFASEWTSTRGAKKKALLSSIQSGLRIALNASAPKSGFHSELANLSRMIEDWAASNSPRLDPSIEAFASTDLPSERAPEKRFIDQFFRDHGHGFHDFALLVGSNPWIAEMVFEKEQDAWPKPELLFDQIVRSFGLIVSLRRRAEAETEGLEHTIKVELAIALRETLSDIEADLAGFFVFRDVLDKAGLHPVVSKLGERVEQRDLSSQKHKLIRDPNKPGALRAFSLGIRVDDTTVGSVTVMKSGDEDDRD